MKSETQLVQSLRPELRLKRSSGQGVWTLLIVVRTTLPRITPRNPSRRISRSTVQRAKIVLSRANCFQTLSAP